MSELKGERNRLIEQIRQETKEILVKSLLKDIGKLRQWLNEDRITDNNKLVTNEDIVFWLSLK